MLPTLPLAEPVVVAKVSSYCFEGCSGGLGRVLGRPSRIG